ncbi:hypothetical protein [Solidesulfovibrio fructosivorans]|uniref:hypothetical protein n=1 Tax=Solidesulfovibrio fructosivorans TaxID=878 RepID=UPI001F31CF9F|nr:hypothetical protein [Solidesulfovibrio fructosivorans]
MFNSNVTELDYACRDCGKQWKITSSTGKIIKIGSAILTGVLTVAIGLFSGDSNGSDGSD